MTIGNPDECINPDELMRLTEEEYLRDKAIGEEKKKSKLQSKTEKARQ